MVSSDNNRPSRGMASAVDTLDQQIAALRAKPELDRRPATILEISASRSAPREQKARLITERAAKQAAAGLECPPDWTG